MNDPGPRGYSRFAPAILVVAIFLAAEGLLARRSDLTDHGRFTAAVYMTAARNYARYGFTEEGGAPLANGGTRELAREARYLNWPTRDFLELGVWFKLFGASVRVARAQTVAWSVLALVALAWGGAALARGRGRPEALGAFLLPVALATTPFFIYYAHAACPQQVTISAIAIAAAARIVRLEKGGRFALAVQAAALAIAVSTNWEGVLFAAAWAVSDLRAKRRDGLVLLGLAAAIVGLQVIYIVVEGGTDAWLKKAEMRASAPPLLQTLVRVIRYGRSLGYGQVLLAAVWTLRLAASPPATRLAQRERSVALELLLAPIPWFLVFRQHVAVHDVEMFYFAPGVALAATLALLTLSRLRLALAVAMLVGTGAAIGAVLEHKDDLTLPRALGEVARKSTDGDQAVATSTEEFSVAWEADRFVHFGVRSVEQLAKLTPAPARFVVPDPSDSEVADADRKDLEALIHDLSRYPVVRRGRALVFDVSATPGPPRRSP